MTFRCRKQAERSLKASAQNAAIILLLLFLKMKTKRRQRETVARREWKDRQKVWKKKKLEKKEGRGKEGKREEEIG